MHCRAGIPPKWPLSSKASSHFPDKRVTPSLRTTRRGRRGRRGRPIGLAIPAATFHYAQRGKKLDQKSHYAGKPRMALRTQGAPMENMNAVGARPCTSNARAIIVAWRREYNEERPKKTLGGLTPAAYAKQQAENRPQ